MKLYGIYIFRLMSNEHGNEIYQVFHTVELKLVRKYWRTWRKLKANSLINYIYENENEIYSPSDHWLCIILFRIVSAILFRSSLCNHNLKWPQRKTSISVIRHRFLFILYLHFPTKIINSLVFRTCLNSFKVQLHE